MKTWDKHKDMIKLVDENNELLLEFRIGDKYHRKLLELGMIKLLEDSLGDEIKNHINKEDDADYYTGPEPRVVDDDISE